MACFGALLIALGLPLLIGFFVGEKKNVMWRNLGLLLIVSGVLIMIVGGIAGF